MSTKKHERRAVGVLHEYWGVATGSVQAISVRGVQ
ncbi:Uncharacterised protein [Achromobacter spanius]|nr:hypothetical protein LMG5911_03292 [Achromobacter spanius]SPT38209.1 Uncharacterised protein [Achromobacter denitrificans]VEE57167.1 Uncharacterised protein [Achromobacter spanius]